MKWTLLFLISLNIPISEIHAQGTWYLPGPNGKSIIPYSGCFIDAQTGFAVKNPNRLDTADAIQKTIDGGATWTSLSSGPAIPLRSIHFPRYNLGFVMAANGTTLLKTKDGGMHWDRWEADQHLDNIRFMSDSIGYALPDRGGFLKSVDGGKTWKTISLGGVQPDYFYFGTERDGFIVPRNTRVSSDSSLAKTKDGGATWTWISGVPKLEEMAFLNSDSGFATGSQTMTASSQNGLPQVIKGVYKTTDGGKTWKVVLSNRVEETAPFWEYQRPVTLSSTLGYVLANKASNSGPSLGSRIMKTENGGISWTIDYETSDMHLFSLQFPEVGTGFAKGSVVLGNADLDRAVLIRYRVNLVTSVMPQKHSLPILRIGKGRFTYGDHTDFNAAGRSLSSSTSSPKAIPFTAIIP